MQYSFDDLILFLKAVESKSFLRAANYLNISQPTISRRMNQLEKDLGFKLFVQDGRNFKLTESGQVVYGLMQKQYGHINKLDELINEIHNSKQKYSGKLRIVAPVVLSEDFITPHIVEFTQKYPEINLEIFYKNQEVDLVEQNIDIALLSYIPTNNIQKFMKLFSYKTYIYCSQEYSKKYGIPQTVEELAYHNIVNAHLYDDKSIQEVEFTHRETSEVKTYKVPECRITISSLRHARILIESNEVIAPYYQHLVKENDGFIHILPDYTIDNIIQSIYLTTHPYRNLTIIRLFVEYIKDKLINR